MISIPIEKFVPIEGNRILVERTYNAVFLNGIHSFSIAEHQTTDDLFCVVQNMLNNQRNHTKAHHPQNHTYTIKGNICL